MASLTPALPRIASNYDPFSGFILTSTAVIVASGASISAGIATAIAAGKHIVQLVAGGIYTESVQLPKHSLGWMMLCTQGVTVPTGTRITPALAASNNFATIKAPDASYGVYPAIGAGGWILESFSVTAASTAADTHSLVSLVSEVNLMTGDLTDVSHKMAARHLYAVGVGADAYGTSGRSRAITIGANGCELTDCWSAKINFGGLSYANQSQSHNGISGVGKIRIENCFIWGASEPISFGGAAQTGRCIADQICISDVIIRRNHIYRTPAVVGHQASENGIEFKIGRRVLIEQNIFENGWPTTQHGCAFVLWSAEAEDPSTNWASTCDVTVRNNWIKNYAQCANVKAQYNGTIRRATRIRFYNNLCTGMGGTIATSIGDGVTSNYTARILEPDNDLHDFSFENNTCINTGGFLIVTTGTGSVDGSFTRFDFRRNVFGQTANTGNTFFNAGSASGSDWTDANANGSNRWELNVLLIPGLTDARLPNGGANDTLVNALADLQLVNSTFLMSDTTKYADLSNIDFAVGSPFKGQGKGCDIPSLITALAGVEAPADQLALYA